MSEAYRVNGSPAKRKNVGKLAIDLMEKGDEKINAIDLQREIHKGKGGDDGFEANFFKAIDRGKKIHNENFFLVILLKKERLLHNVVRHYFFTRYSCPTPDFDQCVYRYNQKDECIEFLWTVPDWQTVEKLVAHYHCVCDEQKELADFACMFKRGDLTRMAQILNNEL